MKTSRKPSIIAQKLAGKFIVLDGGDGTGKSTQIALLDKYLQSVGLVVCRVRDPGGTAIGMRIREILLDRNCGEMTARCELMLYMASRAQLASEIIRPALARGECVLSDRYISSTVAYQGAGGVDAETIITAGMMAVGDTWPDLTVILDVPAGPALARAGAAGEHDRVEAKAQEYHNEVARLFRLQVSQNSQSFALLDGRGTIEQVQHDLQQLITDKFI